MSTARLPVLLALSGTVALSLWSAPSPAAGPERYALDPVHTRVLFAISHAGFSSALGTVSGSTGRIDFDRDDWSSAHLDVSVPIARLDLGDAKWSAAALASNLLDGRRYPQARFVSTAVQAIDRDHAKVCGDLTLHGISKPTCLDVTFNQLKRHPLPPFRRTAGFSASATISRAAFGITAWKSVIGDTVQLRIEAEALRDNRAGNASDTGGDNVPGSLTPPVGNAPADAPAASDAPPRAPAAACSRAPCEPSASATP